MREDSIPVKLNGIDLVWIKNPDGSGALAYSAHVDAGGDIKFDHCLSESYAHVFPDGEILRYGRVIGKRDDLFPIPNGEL